jgi:hypothetical protein
VGSDSASGEVLEGIKIYRYIYQYTIWSYLSGFFLF